MRLLYVDDDRINLMLFENACAALANVQLLTAADGAEALALAREQPPQVLVIDMHLPDTDGHALLHRLRRETSLGEVPAFLCSADDPEQLRHVAAEAGFAGCWAKPVDSRTLRQALAELGLEAVG